MLQLALLVLGRIQPTTDYDISESATPLLVVASHSSCPSQFIEQSQTDLIEQLGERYNITPVQLSCLDYEEYCEDLGVMECPSLIYFTDNTARPYTYKSFEQDKIEQWLALQQAPMFKAVTNESELQEIIQKVEYPTYFVLKLANAVQLPEYERELSTVKGMGVYGVMNAPAT